MVFVLLIGCGGNANDGSVQITITGPSSVLVGNEITLSAEVTPAQSGVVGWKSSDVAKATVSGGVVKGLSAGSVTITALVGKYNQTYNITVTAATPLNEKRILDEYGDFGGSIDWQKYGYGAPLNGQYDQSNSPYYISNDFYNMKSTQDRTILPNFATYQQTMQDSSGIACALMILHHEGFDVRDEYNEVALVEQYEELNSKEVFGNGTDLIGMRKLFVKLDYEVVSGFTAVGGSQEEQIRNLSIWLHEKISLGCYVMVRYQDNMDFRWHIIIGVDDMGTDDFGKDDVLIFADPYDGFDHNQDGYSISAAGRFFRWWHQVATSGVRTNAQDCLVIYPKKAPVINRVTDSREPVQTVPELHMLLNPDGSYGGTRDAQKYGVINEKNGQTDHLYSPYWKFPDYYNMINNSSRLICTGFRAFQQTMASSCGICSTMAVMAYYGWDVVNTYNEVALVNKYESVTATTVLGSGVGGSGLRTMMNSYGVTSSYRSYGSASYVDSSSMVFSTYQLFVNWMKTNLTKGTPMPVSHNPHGGHWEVIIAYDNMGTSDYIYDDVLVLADSHDTWDHYQDGYNTYPATLFYRQWYNGSYTWNQQYNIFDRVLK